MPRFDIGDKPLSATCQNYLLILKEIAGKDTNAYTWMCQVIQASLIWDHIVDRDEFHVERADEVFEALITEWPINPFLRQNAEFLMPMMVAAVTAWRSQSSRELDYQVYRDVPCAVAFIKGGNTAVKAFMPRIIQLVEKMREEDDERDRPMDPLVAIEYADSAHA